MTAEYLVQILHGVGFLTGAALYGMLLAMVVQNAGLSRIRRGDGLALVTGVLGLAWNLGALVLVTHPRTTPALLAVAYAALGVLPAVFVHAAVRSWKGDPPARRAGRWITGLAYLLSGGAALAQLGEAALSHAAPSRAAFQALASGFLVLVAADGRSRRPRKRAAAAACCGWRRSPSSACPPGTLAITSRVRRPGPPSCSGTTRRYPWPSPSSGATTGSRLPTSS